MTKEANRYFKALATIQASQWLLKRIINDLQALRPIDFIVDEATGYDKERIDTCISLLEVIKRCKKIINESPVSESGMIEELKKLRKK